MPLVCDTGKQYFSFVSDGVKSRPVNARLYDCDIDESSIARVLACDLSGFDEPSLGRILYTIAISYCAAADMVSRGDKKTPATFFEVFVGHMVGRMLGANPTNAIDVQSIDIHNSLPTDFIFDLGPHKNKIHLPVKTSTRERVIQVWAHQRVLDGVFGLGRFKGVLVSIAETNAKQPDGVTEVCLPGQWVIYQMFIAQMHRVYYLDIPAKYAALGQQYPFIQVKSFASFFGEVDLLVNGPPAS